MKDTQFCVKNLNPQSSEIFPTMIWIFMESEGDEIKSKQASKRDGTLKNYKFLIASLKFHNWIDADNWLYRYWFKKCRIAWQKFKETLVFENFAAEQGHYWSSIFPNFVAQPLEFEAVQLVWQLQTGTPFG